MSFQRGIDPKKAMSIGIMAACHSMIKEMDGIILNESQSLQHRKWTDDPTIWDNPKTGKKYNNAGEFDWLEPWLISNIASTSIVIEVIGDEFKIVKNLFFPFTKGYSGHISSLYQVILCWYEKKREYRIRKRWRVYKDANSGEPICIFV